MNNIQIVQELLDSRYKILIHNREENDTSIPYYVERGYYNGLLDMLTAMGYGYTRNEIGEHRVFRVKEV